MPKMLTQISSISNKLKHLIGYKYKKIRSIRYRHFNSATLIYHNWEPEIIILLDKSKLQIQQKKTTEGNSAKISRDLDANEEHTHNISNNNRRNTSRSIRNLNRSITVTIKCKIQHYDTDSTENEHESRRETFDDILAVNTAGHENDRSY